MKALVGGGWVSLICRNTTMRVYGAWVRIYYVLCSKTYGIFRDLSWSPAGSRQAARGARICQTCIMYWISFVGWEVASSYYHNRWRVFPSCLLQTFFDIWENVFLANILLYLYYDMSLNCWMFKLVWHKAFFAQSPTNMVLKYVMPQATILMALKPHNGYISSSHFQIENNEGV